MMLSSEYNLLGDLESRRSRAGMSKHAIPAPTGCRFQQSSNTRRDPWTIRAENRARNKRQRTARRLNRAAA